MKIKILTVALSIFIAFSALILAGGPRTGQGRHLDATSVSQIITNLNAQSISIINGGTQDVFFLVNSYTNEMTIRATNGTAFLLEAGDVFTIEAPSDNNMIKNILFKTTNNPSEVLIGAF